ncbi:pentatricopeptide repeat-containing protein At4g16390, chloroplastic [Magnolia sinica]|uniref:pentatricopeptide repeat-containing protein At4g16390, chloroplastic n=1 Tax=Magnolia sinica TaxID=86752 RepID=UPI00265A232B|nr:pentatricopeptide repeat-containing protein At4g16390, chloroplastic [Magnolia sinica]XP_058070617.1 pentatricopeptide repeat-containing protein At4g16390, chloroplastic [Magnolia sinica]
MAVHLSSIYPSHGPPLFFSKPIISSPHFLQISPSPFPYNLKLTPFSPLSKTLLKPYLSLHQDPIPQTPQDPPPQTLEDPKTPPKSKNSIWINPKSPRASTLRRQSSDFRYSSLAKLAESLNSCIPSQEHVSNILSALGEKPSEQDAVIVLNNMETAETALLALRHFQSKLKPKREAILYNVTMKVYRKNKNWDGAVELLEEMIERGIKPDNVTFSTIISCARRCSLPNKAIEWFEKMAEFGCNPDDVTYSAMIDAYGQAGNVNMALSLYDRARKERWRLDLVTFTTLIRIYGMSGNFDGALNVYEEMKALGVKPNLVTYNTLLDAMGRAGRPWQVKSIYREVGSNGFLPNWGTYAALLRAYGRARYAGDALAVYREMKEKGMELNVVLYNTLLAMCADIGYVDEAVEIFQEMERSEVCKPDSWTFSSLITIYSCSGQVSEAERILNKMMEVGFEPNIFVLTSLIQCYGKAKRTDDVVRTFDRLLELGIAPDDRFCGCLLNVMTHTPKEELGKLIGCIERANAELGSVVKLLVEEKGGGVFKREAEELFNNISKDVRKAYCNCMIDLCVNLDLLGKSCELLELGLALQIYTSIQSKSPTQWSLHLRSLSLGAALTALHIWMNDLSRAVESGEELPPLLGIHTGHGKHKYSENGLAAVFESHLRELNAPFHEAPDKVGWFLTTKVAAESWLESRSSPELVAA